MASNRMSKGALRTALVVGTIDAALWYIVASWFGHASLHTFFAGFLVGSIVVMFVDAVLVRANQPRVSGRKALAESITNSTVFAVMATVWGLISWNLGHAISLFLVGVADSVMLITIWLLANLVRKRRSIA